jgi:hypothetical protein
MPLLFTSLRSTGTHARTKKALWQADDTEDNLDFVSIEQTSIHPNKGHDNQVNELLDRAKTWDALNEARKEGIIAGMFFNADHTHDLVSFSTHGVIGAVTLLQHSLLHACSSARMELLETFYKETTFLCNFDFGAGEFNQPVLDIALRHLGPTRCSVSFASSTHAAQHLFITFLNLDSEMTVRGIYQWVSLFLNSPLSRGRLSRPGHSAN